MHLRKEMVDEVRVEVIYARAKDMEADGFSKPYEPVKHKPFMKLVLGEKANAVNRWALYIEENGKEETSEEVKWARVFSRFT